MELFFIFILFIFACIFSFFVPGFLLLSSFNIKLNSVEKSVLSLFMGLSLFMLATYLLAWINLSEVCILILLICTLYTLTRKRKEFLNSLAAFRKIESISLLIIGIGSVLFTFIMFFSGWINSSGDLQFFGVNNVDGIRHLAYTKSMMLQFPPQHPGLEGVTLRGFHYLYDFMLAKFALFYGFTIEDLYFRLFPFFISLLYGLGFYILVKKITENNWHMYLILFFLYFSQSFSWVFLFINSEFAFEGAIVQPLGLIVNPFTVMAMGMFAAGIFLIPYIKKSWKYALMAGLILGVLSQTKVYIGIIGIACVILYSAFLLIKYRKRYIIPSIILLGATGITTVITYFPNNLGAGGLVFRPLLYYNEYMQTDAFQPFQWEIKRQLFEQHNNTFRIILLYIQAIFVFWVFNLGTRLLILLKSPRIFKADFWRNDYNLLLVVASTVLILLGSFFVQTVSTFDTVQFFWLTLVLLSIPSGIVWGEIFKNHKIIAIVILLVLTLPALVSYSETYINEKSSRVVKAEELPVYEAVSTSVPEDEFIIVVPERLETDEGIEYKYPSIPKVSAVTGIQTYYEGGEIPNDLEKIQEERKEKVKRLHAAMSTCDEEKINSVIESIGSKNIVSFQNFPCMTTIPLVVTSMKTDEVNFYKLK